MKVEQKGKTIYVTVVCPTPAVPPAATAVPADLPAEVLRRYASGKPLRRPDRPRRPRGDGPEIKPRTA